MPWTTTSPSALYTSKSSELASTISRSRRKAASKNGNHNPNPRPKSLSLRIMERPPDGPRHGRSRELQRLLPIPCTHDDGSDSHYEPSIRAPKQLPSPPAKPGSTAPPGGDTRWCRVSPQPGRRWSRCFAICFWAAWGEPRANCHDSGALKRVPRFEIRNRVNPQKARALLPKEEGPEPSTTTSRSHVAHEQRQTMKGSKMSNTPRRLDPQRRKRVVRHAIIQIFRFTGKLPVNWAATGGVQ